MLSIVSTPAHTVHIRARDALENARQNAFQHWAGGGWLTRELSI